MRRMLFLAAICLIPIDPIFATAPVSGTCGARCGRRPRALRTSALKCLHNEYPNHISHTLDDDQEARTPHELTPAFYGCLDWHSDVHGHWLLVAAPQAFPDAPFASAARAEIARSLTAANVAGEVAYLQQPDRASFERPYGLAWLLQLAAELRQWHDPQAQQWLATLQPLETEAAARLASWLPKLHYPIRVGEHDQTAFAFGLSWDWAVVADDARMRGLLQDAAHRFYQGIATARSPTSLPERTFSRPASRKRTSCAGSSRPRTYSRWLSAFPAARFPAMAPAPGSARRGHRSRRPEARPHRWAEPESRVDAARHRPRPAAGRSAGFLRCAELRNTTRTQRCRR